MFHVALKLRLVVLNYNFECDWLIITFCHPGPITRKLRKPFLVHLYLKTENCIRLKRPCVKRTSVYIKNT